MDNRQLFRDLEEFMRHSGDLIAEADSRAVRSQLALDSQFSDEAEIVWLLRSITKYAQRLRVASLVEVAPDFAAFARSLERIALAGRGTVIELGVLLSELDFIPSHSDLWNQVSTEVVRSTGLRMLDRDLVDVTVEAMKRVIPGRDA